METELFFSVADAKDHMVKDNLALKQEGHERPQAQGEGAGECYLTLI